MNTIFDSTYITIHKLTPAEYTPMILNFVDLYFYLCPSYFNEQITLR